MKVQFNVFRLIPSTGEQIHHQETKIFNTDSPDSFELMKKALKSTINAIGYNPEFNGDNFQVIVVNKDSDEKINYFNFMQVYSEDNKNG